MKTLLNSKSKSNSPLNINNLTHQLLIATPQVDDDLFGNSVIYICRHDEQGVLGLIVNKPSFDLDVSRVFDKLDIDVENANLKYKHPLNSGPVHPEVGFILHTGQPIWESSFTISENICLTTSSDIFQYLATNENHMKFQLCLGHASWDNQQLINEINQGDWLITPASLELLFFTDFEQIWQQAGQELGVNLEFLSSETGNA